MAFFPFMTEIEGKNILIVGGGKSAFHKVRSFLLFGGTITVIAKKVSPDITRLSGDIKVFERSFIDTDLEGKSIVVAATDDKQLNRAIAEKARSAGIPVNAVDDKEYCDFIFPAILKKENYSVAVCTDGRSPVMAARIRNTIADALPDSFDEAVGELGIMRESVLRTTDSHEERSRLFKAEADKRAGIRKIRIGTRSSALAMAQTEIVMEYLRSAGAECEAVIMRTEGDRHTDRPLWTFGGKSVFVNEFEDAILAGKIDIAIHSAKDMAQEIPEGLEILACPEREDPRDVLVSLAGRRPEDIRIVGTSSRRRQVLIHDISEKYETRSLRGNVPSRINKLRRGEFDAVILAAAGLRRLGLDDEPDLRYEYLDPEMFVPAAGQGIIAIEGRSKSHISNIIRALDDPEVSSALKAERSYMEEIGAGCHDAVSAWADVKGDKLVLRTMRYEDGDVIRETREVSL